MLLATFLPHMIKCTLNFIQACNAMYNRPRYHLHWFHDSLFLPNRRQIKDNRTKVSSAAKSERSLLHDWLRAAAELQLACSDQWPQPGPGNIKPEPEPEGGWRGQPPARAIRSQLRSHGNSQERGPRGSWHPHLMSWRMPSLHPECIVRENNTCQRVMQQTRTKNAEIF